MSGNTLGTLFSVTTFGESHGPAIGCVVDGCPPGMALAEPTSSPISTGASPAPRATSRSAASPTQWRSCPACSKASTTGTPIALLIRNEDERSKDYGNIADSFRPGPCRLHLLAEVRHSRLSRRRPASARLTAPRSRAGAIARNGCASTTASTFAASGAARRDRHPVRRAGSMSDANPFFAANARHRAALEAYMDALRKYGRPLRRAHRGRGTRRAGRLGRAGLRQARCRHRVRDDGHQRRQGRRDRRRLRERRAERHRALATR